MRSSSSNPTIAEDEPKLISQGGYGCVYYPSFPVKIKSKEVKSSKRYISKLQKNIYPARFEDYIGKIIQDIPGYNYFFVPVLKTHNIDLATINQDLIQKCDAVTKFVKKQKKHHERASDEYEEKMVNPYGEINAKGEETGEIDYEILNKNFIIQKMKYIEGATDLKKYVYAIISKIANNAEEYESDHNNYEEPKITKRRTATKMQTAGKKKIMKQRKQLEDDRRLHRYISKTLLDDQRITPTTTPTTTTTTYDKQIERIKNKVTYKLISIVFDCYERISDCLHILAKHQIIHNDLKYNNILLDMKTLTPMMIDFGLSIYVKQLLENPWKEKNETGGEVNSETIKPLSRGHENNYFWKQHFYVHAPDYYLWPIESHIISFLIIESDTKTLRYEDLENIAYTFTFNHEALMYVSSDFKYKYMHLCISVYKKYIDRPREEVINELIQYWQKWDIYSNNVMFIRLFYSIVIKTDKTYNSLSGEESGSTEASGKTFTGGRKASNHVIDSEYETTPELESYFESKKMHLKSYYFLNDNKILDIIEFMIMNIHPDPEKRLLPEEAKTTLNSILYYC
jgi:serine/threonine protein kinase